MDAEAICIGVFQENPQGEGSVGGSTDLKLDLLWGVPVRCCARVPPNLDRRLINGTDAMILPMGHPSPCGHLLFLSWERGAEAFAAPLRQKDYYHDSVVSGMSSSDASRGESSL